MHLTRESRQNDRVLLLALSCLQGRPMGRAFAELAALPGVDGIQLTPGCQLDARLRAERHYAHAPRLGAGRVPHARGVG